MDHSIKILHIEDVASDAELVDRILKKSDIKFEKIVVDNRQAFIRSLTAFDPDIILSDHSLPAFNSLEALKILKHEGINTPFILITSTVSEEFAVNVMKEGAIDYVLKDRLQRLPAAIVNALEKHQSYIDNQTYLNKIVASENLFTKAELIAEFGTWRIDIINHAIHWSTGTYLLLGYKHGEVEPTVKNFIKNIHPDDMKRVESLLKNVPNNIHSGEMDFRVVGADGSIRFIYSQFELEKNENGQSTNIIGFNQDITRSKLAQDEIQNNIEELKAASDRQSAILNALPPNIVLLNEAGKIVAMNESWRKLTLENNLGIPKYGLGYSYLAVAEKATGIDEALRKKLAKGIEEVTAGGSDEFFLEYSCFYKGEKAWFEVIVAPLVDKTKKGAVILHIDITARKKAEELQLQSEANLQTIFENTDIAYVLCNAENKIVSFNTKADELCIEQFKKKLKIGGNAFNYFPKNKTPNIKDAVQRVMRNEMVIYETSYDFNDTLKWYEVRWAGILNDQKKNSGFILAFKDITERKISDLERDRITADLVQRNKDLEQFTYIVSHNLRAPVANIIGLSNMLNSSEFDITEHQEVKSALSTSVNVLDQIIMDLNHILQVRRYVNEKSETVLFQSLVEDITLSLNNLIKSENVTVVFDFSIIESMFTVKSYMHSIFYNLILNSIKYKRPNVDPVISIVTRKKEDKLEILFDDNCKGIDAKNFKNLFGLYKRFDTSVEGKGMGLFMVKMQVESLGGKITVQSELGLGTTFKVEFPEN